MKRNKIPQMIATFAAHLRAANKANAARQQR